MSFRFCAIIAGLALAFAAAAPRAEAAPITDSDCFPQGVNDARDGETLINACDALLKTNLSPSDVSIVQSQRGEYFRFLFKKTGQRKYADLGLQAYAEAVRADPRNQIAYFDRASLYEDMGELAKTAGAFDELTALFGGDSYAGGRCHWRAVARLEPAQSLAICEALRSRQSSQMNVDADIGALALQLGRNQEAWDAYNNAVASAQANGGRTGINTGEALFGRGVAALRLGRTAEGRADIAEANEINKLYLEAQDPPTYAEAFARMGIVP